MDNLFAYGTLMCDEIMREVAGCCPLHLPGMLRGYRRRCVMGELYPALVPDSEGCVEGVVYRNVPDLAWDRLDRFEGEMYARQPALIDLGDGEFLPAATYVVRPEFRDRLDHAAADWDFAHFLQHGKLSFQRHYKGYQSLKSEP